MPTSLIACRAGTNTLSDHNSVAATTGLKSNAAGFSAASQQYLTAADSTSLSTGDIDFTLAAQVYLNNTNTAVILNKGSVTLTDTYDYRLTHVSGAGFRFRVGPDGGATAAYVSSGVVSANAWHTVVAWHNAGNNTINIQVDNGAINSVTYNAGATDTTYPLTVGAFSDGSQGLDGRIDEVALYKRVLTAAERSWLFNSGTGRAYSDLTPPPANPPAPTVTTLTYDHAGRKRTMTDPDMGYWTYDYDALGNLTSQTDARGCTTSLSYDALNRLTQKTYSNCPTTPTVNYYYDGQSFAFNNTTYDTYTNPLGRRTGMLVSGSNATAWNYDTRGRMTSETVNAGTAYTTQWTSYNSADLPVTMQYPDGEVVTNSYNNRMLLNSVIGDSTYVSSTTYDSAGRPDLHTFGNTTQTDYVYYPWNTSGQSGRLQYLKSGTSGSPTSLQNMTYTYDAVGNISSMVDSLAGPQTQSFGYDTLNRLTSASATGGSVGLYNETYSYDSAGNLDVKAGVDLNYNDANHAHAVTHIGTSQNYWYDANGNQITRVIGVDTFNLIYDAENRLVEVKKNNVSLATFVYDGDGRRVKSTIDNVTMTFVGNHYEVTGSQITKYYFAGTQRVAMRKYTIPSSMVVEYFLGDHLGSTSLTTDTTGAKVSEMRYKPWGEVRSSWTSGTLTPSNYKLPDYTFTGQFSYMDDLSTTSVTEGFGLLFYNARMYDPATGHFTSADTVVTGNRNTNAQTVQDVANSMYTPLTVNYAEPQILTKHNAVNAFIQAHGGSLLNVKEEEKKKAKIVGVPLNSQVLDRYAYSLNSPIQYVDPTGYDSYGVTFTLNQFDYFLAILGSELIDPLANAAFWSGVKWGVAGAVIGGMLGMLCVAGALVCGGLAAGAGAAAGFLGGYAFGGGWDLSQVNKFMAFANEALAYARLHDAQTISIDWYGFNGGYREVIIYIDGNRYGSVKIKHSAWEKIVATLFRHAQDIKYQVGVP